MARRRMAGGAVVGILALGGLAWWLMRRRGPSATALPDVPEDQRMAVMGRGIILDDAEMAQLIAFEAVPADARTVLLDPSATIPVQRYSPEPGTYIISPAVQQHVLALAEAVSGGAAPEMAGWRGAGFGLANPHATFYERRVNNRWVPYGDISRLYQGGTHAITSETKGLWY